MQFKNKENKAVITQGGSKIYVSRSVAICALIITEDGKAVVTKRSNKVDFSGKWALPCGYLDWDESIHQALIREVYEELSVDINGEYVRLYDICDSPQKDAKQNITFHFIIRLNLTSDQLKDKIKLCDESTEFDFISKKDIMDANFRGKEFAFSHDERLIMTIRSNAVVESLHECCLDIETTSQLQF